MVEIPGPYATTAERVAYLRETREIGLEEAKRIVWKEDLLHDIAHAEDLSDIKFILKEIVNERF